MYKQMIHRKTKRIQLIWKLLPALLCCLALTACDYDLSDLIPLDTLQTDTRVEEIAQGEIITAGEIPPYSGKPYIVLNGNHPDFEKSALTETSFEKYSELDSLGRCGTAYACIGRDLMPTEPRGNISHIKPTGWHSVRYDHVEGRSLYNRSHLIAHQLAGEDANEKNLITGTRYMNADGMIPFENIVADYVKETGNHVLYQVTPVFKGDNLLAEGVQMKAMSVEDNGSGVSYNVFIYNVQPGVTIDYATGDSTLSQEDTSIADNTQGKIRGNSRSKIYHCPGQAAYEEMADSRYLVLFRTEQEAKDAGYRKAKQ